MDVTDAADRNLLLCEEYNNQNRKAIWLKEQDAIPTGVLQTRKQGEG